MGGRFGLWAWLLTAAVLAAATGCFRSPVAPGLFGPIGGDDWSGGYEDWHQHEGDLDVYLTPTAIPTWEP